MLRELIKWSPGACFSKDLFSGPESCFMFAAFAVKIKVFQWYNELSVNKAKSTCLRARNWSTIQTVLSLKFAFRPKKFAVTFERLAPDVKALISIKFSEPILWWNVGRSVWRINLFVNIGVKVDRFVWLFLYSVIGCYDYFHLVLWHFIENAEFHWPHK